jgi:hypothetical protein
MMPTSKTSRAEVGGGADPIVRQKVAKRQRRKSYKIFELVLVPCSPSPSGYYRMMRRRANLSFAEIVPDHAGGELGVRQREVFSIR